MSNTSKALYKKLKNFGITKILLVMVAVTALSVASWYIWVDNKDGTDKASVFTDSLGEKQRITNFNECMDWAMPWEETDGKVICSAPDNITFEATCEVAKICIAEPVLEQFNSEKTTSSEREIKYTETSPVVYKGINLSASATFEPAGVDNTNDFGISDSSGVRDYLVLEFELINTSSETISYNQSEFTFVSDGVDYSEFLEWFVDKSKLGTDQSQPSTVSVESGDKLNGQIIIFTVEGAPDSNALPSDSSSGKLTWTSSYLDMTETVDLKY